MNAGEIHLFGTGRLDSRVIKEVTLQEFERYKFLCEQLNTSKTLSDTLPIVKANMDELESFISSLSIPQNRHIGSNEQAGNLLTLNRYTVNFLASFALFIDHLVVQFKNTFGEESEKFAALEVERHKIFDENFAYRFCYKLNAFLHVGLPFNRGASQRFDENKQIISEYEVGFDTKRLLTTFSKWRTVKPDLEARGEFFTAKGLFSEAFRCLVELHLEAQKIEKSKLIEYATELKWIVQEAFDMDYLPQMGQLIQGDTEDMFTITLYRTPVEKMQELGLINLKITNPN